MPLHNLRITLLAALLAALLPATAAAVPLTGTVRNLTRDRSQPNLEVVLLRLDQGMNEEARTQADTRGQFSFEVADANVPRLVRVNYQDVNYFRQSPPGTSSVEVEVYDSAPRVNGIKGIVNVLRYQADASSLQVIEVYGVRNDSKPPRTWMGQRTLEIYLPAGAQIDNALVAGPGGMPVNASPVPLDDKGHYGFIFPIRPGETRFQLAYRLPYTGQIDIKPRLTLPVEHLVVMLPKSMQLTPAPGSPGFQQQMEEEGALVHVSTTINPGQEPSFRISGTGTLPEPSSAAAGGDASARPGGGLGPPSEAPDPLRQYRWWILGGFALLLAFGAMQMMRQRPRPASLASSGDVIPDVIPLETAAPVSAESVAEFQPAAHAPSLLLVALKEELFALEVDRQQGRLSQKEYQRAKAALDLVLARALSRSRKAS